MRHYWPRGGCRISASRYAADAFYGRYGEVWQWVDDALTFELPETIACEPTLIRTVLRSH